MSIGRTLNLEKLTAQEFLREVTTTMDENPDVTHFTIRFLDAFNDERMMSLELIYDRPGRNTKH